MKLFVVVEGQGEEAAVPLLLRRLRAEQNLPVELVGRPWREPRHRMMKREHLGPILQLARSKADAVLLLLDADDDCAVEVARRLKGLSDAIVPGSRVVAVVAVREFEAWFLAGIESLKGKRDLPLDLERPAAVESIRDAKGWLSEKMQRRYSPTLDQPAFTAALDLAEAQRHSRSFTKLVETLALLARQVEPTTE
jgi:hypothetical protein